MKLIDLDPKDLVVSEDLSRSGSAKQFEERLKSSIEEIGLAEPIKVAQLPTGKYVVIDGGMRLRAIASIREANPNAFSTIPAYEMDYARRYELRYQTDIYQDLLPSQLAGLVEHLHRTEHVRKIDIARYIGVSPATLRNYTGLWRLLQRGGLFAKVVELMDVEVIPSSNPYAWLRLTANGLRHVLEQDFTDGERAELWIERSVLDARRGKTIRFPIKFVEATTDALPAEYYREGEQLRNVKRDLGLRRGMQSKIAPPSQPILLDQPTASSQVQGSDCRDSSGIGDTADVRNSADSRDPVNLGNDVVNVSIDTTDSYDDTLAGADALRYLSRISRLSSDPVLRSAARSLKAYLQ